MLEEQLDKINRFTRRSLTADEVYIFSVILCDNDIDRDCERFSDTALEKLKELFVGKTGIFDHDPKTSNQSARIFDTELIEDASRKTVNGDTYKFVKGHVYMVKTDGNKSLIAEIDGGIKKEVSISCSASERYCSVCGCDKTKSSCAHVKGKIYGSKLCHTVLSGITDAYEWSFVAVPAQVNAGVTKHFSASREKISSAKSGDAVLLAEKELKRDIRRLAFFCGGTVAAEKAFGRASSMGLGELVEFKKKLESELSFRDDKIQLAENENNSADRRICDEYRIG